MLYLLLMAQKEHGTLENLLQVKMDNLDNRANLANRDSLDNRDNLDKVENQVKVEREKKIEYGQTLRP